MALTSINAPPLATPAYTASGSAAAASAGNFWGEGGFSFKTALDIINPLQHVPVVATLYRSLTGATISSGARITGDTLYGGPIGLASALANEAVQTQTGRDIGSNAIASLKGDKTMQTADNAPALSATGHLSANQRAAYNAYVSAGMLA